ncbi:MAG: hypothetical protein KatS3mg027_0976 [Bacteroidia bacterium]|nr:MAG: hypothetical protein KatS3mg027_0976 [Bacteroidia bacterium]
MHLLVEFSTFFLAVTLAGGIQILFGILKGGKLSYYFPSSVITGMLTAIGIIIILKQLPHAFGYDRDYEGDESFIQPDRENTFSELLHFWKYIHPASSVVFTLGLCIVWFWEKKIGVIFPRFAKIVQAPLMIVLVGILVVKVFITFNPLSIQDEHLVNIPPLKELIETYKYPVLSRLNDINVWYYGFIIAFVASIETLLCVEATDIMDPQKRITNRNRELLAQGTGNIISGLLGGLPVTQVIVRSSANINFGAKTKMSAIFHGVWLLVSVLFFRELINLIPLSALATILIVVGYKLAQPRTFLKMYQKGWKDFIPFLVTVLVILFTDLLIGTLVGLVTAILLKKHWKFF